MDVVKVAYKPFTARAARHALLGHVRTRLLPQSGRFTRADVTELLDAAWKRYDDEATSLPTQPTRGSTMNVRLASFTFAFFQELLATGVERPYAIELVADATWHVYRLWARIATATGSGPSTALGFAHRNPTDAEGAHVSLRFPFNDPGYRIEPVAVEGGTGFDVVHCPVADYFRKRGAVDLCTASWCNLDFALSEMTHQSLVRTKTIVLGADRCDFRLKPEAPAESAPFATTSRT